MDNIIYQQIYDSLLPLLPKKWDKIVFYAAYFSDSFNMKYFVKQGKKYLDCFQLEKKDTSKPVKCFMQIHKFLSPALKALPKKDQWYVLTMSIEKTGKIKVNYDYTNHIDELLTWQSNWEKQYLV